MFEEKKYAEIADKNDTTQHSTQSFNHFNVPTDDKIILE